MYTAIDEEYQTVEPTLELLKGWTTEYLQDVEAAGGLRNPEPFATWFAEDFIQTGPNIGPLNKRDFLYSLSYYGKQGFNLGEVIPDLTADLDAWHLDPTILGVSGL